jgi:hypothetical protein
LSWAKKQLDCGAEALWIDMLYRQATLLAQMAGDLHHPAVRESLAAASQIVEGIRRYGEERGRRVYVGSWVGPFVLAELKGKGFPYDPPRVDFVTLSPTIEEVLQKRLDEEKWTRAQALVRAKYGEIPLIAFIDWSFDESPLVAFSQRLTPQEQRETLREFDRTFRELEVLFAYPVHGGFMGRNATKLSFGWSYKYDSLAPEFGTYETIRELAEARWQRAVVYWAQRLGFESVSPFHVQYFVDYNTGFYTPLRVEIASWRESLEEGRRTQVFHSYREVIREVRGPSSAEVPPEARLGMRR